MKSIGIFMIGVSTVIMGYAYDSNVYFAAAQIILALSILAKD